MRKAEIEHLAAKMRQLKRTKEGGTILFLGAGASVTAGIPTANGLITEIKKKRAFKAQIESNKPETYDQYMACLSSKDRKKLFKKYVDKAKVNATHLYAAQLIAEGYIDIVVTTNFDPLIIKALHLFNVIPFSYDVSIVDKGIITEFDKPSVIFLHGQSHGFRQLNTEHELQLPREAIRDTFMKISQNHAWIVLGYSGNDPVFDILCSIQNYQENLYWVCYSYFKPPNHVVDNLLSIETKGAYYIDGFNSDSFTKSLKNQFKIATPKILDKPFSYVLDLTESIQKTTKIHLEKVDSFRIREKQLNQAIDIFERGKLDSLQSLNQAEFINDSLEQKFQDIISNHQIHRLDEMLNDLSNYPDICENSPSIQYYMGFIFLLIGHNKEFEDHYATLMKSIHYFDQSEVLDPNNSSTYYNKALAYQNLVNHTPSHDRKQWLLKAQESLLNALIINPKMYSAQCNLGGNYNFLSTIEKDEEDKMACLRKAINAYQKAIELEPENFYAYGGLGDTIANSFRKELKVDHKELFIKAEKGYLKALESAPGHIGAFGELGNLCYYYSTTIKESIREKDRVIKKAIRYYERHRETNTLVLHPTTLLNWSECYSQQFSISKTKNLTLLSKSLEVLLVSLTHYPNHIKSRRAAAKTAIDLRKPSIAEEQLYYIYKKGSENSSRLKPYFSRLSSAKRNKPDEHLVILSDILKVLEEGMPAALVGGVPSFQ